MSEPTVFVVDDDPSAREMIRRQLEKLDCRIVEAADGREALEAAARQKPAFVILDLMMPVMDGFEFLDEFRGREEFRDVAIVVVTAKHLSESDRRALGGNVAQVLEKGRYSREDLVRRIRECMSAGRRPPTCARSRSR